MEPEIDLHVAFKLKWLQLTLEKLQYIPDEFLVQECKIFAFYTVLFENRGSTKR